MTSAYNPAGRQLLTSLARSLSSSSCRCRRSTVISTAGTCRGYPRGVHQPSIAYKPYSARTLHSASFSFLPYSSSSPSSSSSSSTLPAQTLLPASLSQWQSVNGGFTSLGETVLAITGTASPASWLQGLMTANITDIDKAGSGYTAFLNFKGRLVFDALLVTPANTVHSTPVHTYYLIIPTQAKALALSHLSKLNFRRKVQITALDESQVWTVLASEPEQLTEVIKANGSTAAFIDPRTAALGAKVLLPVGAKPVIPASSGVPDVQLHPFVYEMLRTLYGIPSAYPIPNPVLKTSASSSVTVTPELVSEKSLPIDCNLHHLHGIHFNKGCYVGQEVTARAHFQGVVRKRLFTAFLTIKQPHSPHSPSSQNSQATTSPPPATRRHLKYLKEYALPSPTTVNHPPSLFSYSFFDPDFPVLPPSLPVVASSTSGGGGVSGLGDGSGSVMKEVGQLLTVYGNVCVARLRIDPVFDVGSSLSVLHDGVEYVVNVFLPDWWPDEAQVQQEEAGNVFLNNQSIPVVMPEQSHERLEDEQLDRESGHLSSTNLV